MIDLKELTTIENIYYSFESFLDFLRLLIFKKRENIKVYDCHTQCPKGNKIYQEKEIPIIKVLIQINLCIPVIIITNTVIEPLAVMIKFIGALVALTAVFGPFIYK